MGFSSFNSGPADISVDPNGASDFDSQRALYGPINSRMPQGQLLALSRTEFLIQQSSYQVLRDQFLLLIRGLGGRDLPMSREDETLMTALRQIEKCLRVLWQRISVFEIPYEGSGGTLGLLEKVLCSLEGLVREMLDMFNQMRVLQPEKAPGRMEKDLLKRDIEPKVKPLADELLHTCTRAELWATDVQALGDSCHLQAVKELWKKMNERKTSKKRESLANKSERVRSA